MSRPKKTLERVLSGASDANVSFAELRGLLLFLGFEERVRGSHHIFTQAGVPDILNLQPNGNKAKPYQVKQVRGSIVTHGLALRIYPGDDADEEATDG